MTREDLTTKIKAIIKKAYLDRIKSDTSAIEYDELTKFPELKQIIVDLLTAEFDNFISSIDWVAPKPTTFRINLKNDSNFYLIYGKRGWICQIEGKKYYLLNLPEEQRASEAISRMLRYGEPEDKDEVDGGGVDEFPTEEPPAEETPIEEPEA